MAYNPYNAVKGITDEKAKYETTKAGGGTDYNKYHSNAQSFYNELESNGYGDLAGELRSSDYMKSLDILGRYSPDQQGYSDKYGDLMSELSKQMLDYGSFDYSEPAPTYSSKYDGQIGSLLSGIMNYGDFSYNPETDELYSQYKKQYTREGKRATEDAIGSAAALTGGVPSTAAVTAASQAGDYYASQLTDKIPELYQVAYDKYLNDFQKEISKLGVFQTAEQNDYAKYLDQLSKYNIDRNFNYQKWSDGYSQLYNNLSALSSLSDTEYSRYLDQLNREKNETSDKWTVAEAKAKYGDLSGLEALGVDTSNYGTGDGLSLDDQISLAKLAANYGDYSLLKQLGISPTEKTGNTSDDQPGKAYTADSLLTDARQALVFGAWNSYKDFIQDLYLSADEEGISYSDIADVLKALDQYAAYQGYANVEEWINSSAGNKKVSPSPEPVKDIQTSNDVQTINRSGFLPVRNKRLEK